MERKEKIKKIFKYFFIGITIFLFGCVCWCAGKYDNDTNNCISAYAVEDEQYVNMIFDVPCASSQGNVAVIFQSLYNSANSTTTWYNNESEQQAYFVHSMNICYDKINLKFFITFGDDYLYNNNYTTSLLEHLAIIPNTDYTTFNTGSYQYDIANFVFIKNLQYITINNLKYYDLFSSQSKFTLVYYSLRNNNNFDSGPYFIYPLFFFDDINSTFNIPQKISYDTRNTFTTFYNSEFCMNEIIYDDNFTIAYIGEMNGFPSINGFFNKNANLSLREFYLTLEDKYQEGYNSGYAQGYNTGYQNGLNQNAINPFDDWCCKLQLGNSTTHEYVSVGTASEDIMTNHGSTNISEKAQGITWFTENNTTFGSADYWSVSFNAKSRDNDILLSNFGTLVIGTIEQNSFNTILPYNTEVRCSIARDGTSQLLTFILNAGQSSIVDFTNINDVDYSSYYLQNLNLHFTNQNATNSLYYLSINQQNLGNYEDGYSAGYNSAINDTKNNFINGYNQGYIAGQQNGTGEYTFFSLIAAVIDAPITYFTSLFDYEILGTNIKGFLLALLTIGIVLAVLRISLAKK